MRLERRIPGTASSYPDDASLVRAVLEEPEDLSVWPAVGLAEAGLTPGQQAVVSTWRLDSEVRNGGFGFYFAALGEDAAPAAAQALDGLERLGAAEHRALLAAALERFRAAMPAEPEAAGRDDPGEPATEEQYGCSLRAIVGVASAPSLDDLRERMARRGRYRDALGQLFGELDAGYRALAADGRTLERYWAAYVRGHSEEFFTG